MGDPIDSHDWTGPIEDDRNPRAFTYAAGQHQFASDYSRLLATRIASEVISPELNAARRLAAYLFVAPVFLWLSHLVVVAFIEDLTVQDWAGILVLWGLLVVAVAVLLFSIRSSILLWLRRGVTWLGIFATVGLAGVYPCVALKAHANARISPPERAFLVARRERVNFEREDGTRVLGASRGQPRESGDCVSVSVLRGDHGFTWARIIERVPRERHQLFWPIRREDCFSDKPLSSLAS